MKNIKSTIAMKLAHKIAKAFPKMAFKTALKYAWKQVNNNLTIAQRLLTSDFKVTVKARQTMFGKVNDILFQAKGIKESLKRFFTGNTKNDYVLSLWTGF